MNPSQIPKLKKIETFGKTEIEQHRLWLEEQLEWNEKLKENAENTLGFLLDRFDYLFEEKKKMIAEIEKIQREIKKLKDILCEH